MAAMPKRRPVISRKRRTNAAPAGALADPLADLPECVCGVLRMTTRAVTQIYDDALRPAGLRVTQYGLLTRIERLQPVSAAALVGTLHADQTTLARALQVLEKDWLIRRAAHPDKRVKRIELTAAGRKRLAEARRLWLAAQTRMVELIGREDWRETRAKLGRLLEATAGSDRPAPGGGG